MTQGGPTRTGAGAPSALFELAVNRAATTLLGLGLLGAASPGLRSRQAQAALQEWHARTRFARRVPLSEVVRCLDDRPAQGHWHWAGGQEGGWVEGRAAFP
ncbi:hypothetical protein [Deinococcus altitudinis]|uniref:hypothetical protein n=1 Tax=Deinococcus altitudinis TaxID=468914 RepID=UPI0038914AD4